MRLKISHTTHYTFQETAPYGLQQLRVTPKSRGNQQIIHWDISLSGASKQVEFEDQHNNTVILASIDEGSHEVIIKSSGEVEVADVAGVIGQHGGFAPLWYFRRQTRLTEAGNRVRKIVRELGDDHADELARMHALSNMICDAIDYETGTTDAETTAEMALEHGKGVCQDHTHVMLSAARAMNFPARYVGGYLMMNDRIDQEAGHAWAEVYVEPLGWVGFDVSNRISPDARYVRVATGLDYEEAAPVSGIRFGSAGGEMAESMLVNIAVQQ